WFLVSGFWFLVSGFWFLVSGLWFLPSAFCFSDVLAVRRLALTCRCFPSSGITRKKNAQQKQGKQSVVFCFCCLSITPAFLAFRHQLVTLMVRILQQSIKKHGILEG
ncbi:hypothetical protein, partial [Erwinia sp.]|uniref:hypothetical protein n=1 Tax=Erwinia citreus TaxID=558 RepID=UPI00391729E0